MSTELALWSLVHRPETTRIEDKVVLDGDLVIFRDASSLLNNGYIDDRGVVTTLGKRLASRKMVPSAKYPMLKVFDRGTGWVLTGLHAVSAEGFRLTRYTILRLAGEGYLDIGPGGVVQRLTETVRVTILVPKSRLLEVLSNYKVISGVDRIL